MKFDGDMTTRKERMSKKPSAAKRKAMEAIKKGMNIERCAECGKVSCSC